MALQGATVFPAAVKQKNLQKGEYVHRRRGNVMVLKLEDRCNILIISNMQKYKMVETRKKDKSGVSVRKPSVILDYNLC